MSTESKKESTQQTDPWAPQAAALQTAFNGANGALNTSTGAVAPTNFTAQMSPEAMAAFQQMVSQGSNLAIPNQQAATGSALQNAGTAGVTGALSGLSNYNASDATNPDAISAAADKYVAGQNIPDQVRAAMQGATETARDVTMPGIEMNAANTGNTNSSRTGIADGLVQRALAEQSANLNGSLSGAARANGLALASANANAANTANLGALTGAGVIGNNAAATGVNAGTASVATQGALSSEAAAGGAGLTAAQQAELTNQLQQYQAKTSAPFDALKQYMSIIGTNNWGGTTTGEQTSQPSAWDTISGLMSSAGGLAKGGAGLLALA